jgi:hypothetical protein
LDPNDPGPSRPGPYPPPYPPYAFIICLTVTTKVRIPQI